MNEINRDLVVELLPMYLAGEVGEAATIHIRKYLETDMELAEMAKEMARADSLNKIPIPFKKEAAMETFQEAKKWMTIRQLGLAALGTLIFLCSFLFFFLYSIIGR